MNRLLGMALGIACVFSFPGLAAANLNKTPPEITIGTIAIKGTFFCTQLTDAKTQWNQDHGTRIKVNVQCGGVLGNEADMVQKMSNGTIEGAAVTALALRQREGARDIVTLDLPRLTRNKEEYEYILKKYMEPTFNPILKNTGLHVLAWSYLGHPRLFSVEQIEKPEDLKKATTFWWQGDPDSSQVWRENGFKISLSTSDRIGSEMGSMFTSVITLPAYAMGLGVTSKSHFVMTLPFNTLTGVVVLTELAWQAIPEDLRDEFQKKFKTVAEQATQQADTLDKNAMEALCGSARKGNQTCVTPMGEDLEKWENFAATLRDQSTRVVPGGDFRRQAVIGAEFLKKIEDDLQTYRKTHPSK